MLYICPSKYIDNNKMNVSTRVATLLSIVILTILSMPSVAQNLNTSNLTTSPYNRYGYGRLGTTGNSVTRSMGDVGIAIRSNQYTTLANPASLTVIDTLTCIFQVDLDAQFGAYHEGGLTDHKWDAGFSGMSLHMPLWRNFAMSLSLTPYSMVGYSYGSSDKIPVISPTSKHDTLTYASAHSGVGGINNFMMGIGWRPFRTKMQEASVGVNAGWLFGSLSHDAEIATSSQATGTYINYNASVSGLFLQLGAQYTYRLNANRSLTIGATYSPQLNLSVDSEALKYSSTDSIAVSNRYRSAVKLPQRIGVGVSYNVARKLMVTAEAELTTWSKVKGLNPEMQAQEGLFNDVRRVAVGVEYQPKVLTNNYFKVCRYRAGFSAKDSYIKAGSSNLKEYGANLGISLPINKRSALNLGVGYSALRPGNGNLVKEDYLTLNLGLTFNEMMFFRNRLR